MEISAEFEIHLGYSSDSHYPMHLWIRRSDKIVRNMQFAAFNYSPELRHHLIAHGHDVSEYGQTLGKELFQEGLLQELDIAIAEAASLGKRLRLVLYIDRSATELQTLRWEAIRHPKKHFPISSHGPILFSRFLSSASGRTVRLPQRSQTRVIVAVAASKDAATWSLSPIDVEAEIKTAKQGLPFVSLEFLGGSEKPVTRSALLEALRPGADVLYLVAHGGLITPEKFPELRVPKPHPAQLPCLFLEHTDKRTNPVSAHDLIADLGKLPTLPRLVILASCRSASSESAASLAWLLGEAGVPAIVAMHGDFKMGTAEKFLPTLLSSLQSGDSIDAAVAAGRTVAETAGCDDWWMPVLYTRLTDGRIWDDAAQDVSGVTAVPLSEPLRPQEFVGRKKELKALQKALAGAKTPATAAIVGMGGAGKTQLALQAAHKVKAHYPDHQLEINLRGSRKQALSDVAALQGVIRALAPDPNLNLSDEPTSLMAAYRKLLTGKRVLILAEDARDAAQLRPLIPPAGSALLITSRFRFLLDGMVTVDLAALSEGDAIKLLRQHCDRLNPAEAKQIAAACGRLPLALKIAGGMLTKNQTMQVSRYLSGLEDVKRKLRAFMVPNDPDLNMEASITLSFSLLEQRLQTVLCALGVFRESFDLAAVTAVLNVGKEDEAHDLLSELYMCSLIEYDDQHERYRLHDLIRSYALKHIDATAEEAARLRHAQHYLTVAEQVDQLEAAGELPKAHQLFRTEFASIDDAWQWCISRQTPETDELAVEYGAALQIMVERSYSLEAITARYNSLLPIAQRLKRHERIILFKLAQCASTVGDWVHVDQLMQQALDLSQDHLEATVILLSNQAVMAVDCLRYVEAAELAERALSLIRELPNEESRQAYGFPAQLNLGLALYYIEDLDGAYTHFDALLAPNTIDSVDPQTRNSAFLNRGAVWLQQRQLDRAAADLRAAEQHITDQPRIVQAELYRLFAELALASGDLTAARSHCAMAQEQLQFVFGSQSPANARIRNEVAATCARIAAGS